MQPCTDDLRALDALLDGADADFVQALLGQLQQDMQRLHQALMRDAALLSPGRVADFISLRRNLHELKGLALTIGADSLQQLCAEGEILSLDHDGAALSGRIPRILTLCASVCTQLATRHSRSVR